MTDDCYYHRNRIEHIVIMKDGKLLDGLLVQDIELMD